MEMRLAYNFASQFNKTLLSKINLTSVILFRPISGEQKSPTSHYPEIEFPKRSSTFASRPSMLEAFNRFLSKTKELAHKRRYKKRYPNLCTFSTNLKKNEMHKGDVYPRSSNLHKVR